jgi:hypothetical protein
MIFLVAVFQVLLPDAKMDLWNIFFWIFAGYGIVSVTLYLGTPACAGLSADPKRLFAPRVLSTRLETF